MVDTVTRAERSRIMARVQSKNTSTELTVRSSLHAAGFRFRIHRDDLPGKPDIVLPRYSTVVFVHGCLWHGHGCRRFRWPASNASYWRAKIKRNMSRDEKNQALLKDAGWNVSVVWGCDLTSGIQALFAQLRGCSSLPKQVQN